MPDVENDGLDEFTSGGATMETIRFIPSGDG